MPSTNIDTDQIIPARFLTTTTREGLGKALFADWRYDAAGNPRPDFILNRPEALIDYGFRAVISTEIADIFRNNSLKNGLLPVTVDEETHVWLLAHPGTEIAIDLETCTLALADGREVSFPLEPFARYCLMNGVDELGFLLSRREDIEHYERTHAK
jgi:3-isopropylmalate/(R)-2-methylmalate dehydratase small subunit